MNTGKGQDLQNFYHSKKWEKLIALIRMQRINTNGDVICEYCGEPITKAYDCIGHHVIELNESNVNDATISLNQDNVQLVHHRCHNRIHQKFYHGEDARQVFLVYGSPMSGKTTWVDQAKNEGDLLVDMDSIWQCVSGCQLLLEIKSDLTKNPELQIDQSIEMIGKSPFLYAVPVAWVTGTGVLRFRILDDDQTGQYFTITKTKNTDGNLVLSQTDNFNYEVKTILPKNETGVPIATDSFEVPMK